jgi:hypothetical protein
MDEVRTGVKRPARDASLRAEGEAISSLHEGIASLRSQ